MGTLIYIEYVLGRLLSHSKGYDHAMLTNQPGIKSAPKNIEVTSPELGSSGSSFKIEHTAFSPDSAKRDVFPQLSWTIPPELEGQIKEFILCVEDADSPIHPSLFHATHGLFYGIAPSKRSIGPDDLKVVDARLTATPGRGAKEPVMLKGSFKLGMNVRGSVYGGPRPVCGHGPHRYFYAVVALREPLNVQKMSPVATLGEMTKECEGKVCGWGQWVGVWENKWE